MKTILTLFLLSVTAGAVECPECGGLQSAIETAQKEHANVKNAEEAADNSQILLQVDKEITPALHKYKKLSAKARDLLAELLVFAAQNDTSFALQTEHQNTLRALRQPLQKSISRLIQNGVITQNQAELFWLGVDLEQN